MNDQLAPAQFHEGVLVEQLKKRLPVLGKKFQQVAVMNVAGGYQQEFGRTLAELVRGFEFSVFGNQRWQLLVRQSQEKWIWSAAC